MSGSKCGSLRIEFAVATGMPLRAAARAAARRAALLSELRRRLPEIARIIYAPLCSIFVPAGERTYHSAPKLSRPWPVVWPGFVSRTKSVERVAGVGDLPGAVAAADDAEQRLLRLTSCGRLRARQQRRPVAGASSGAGATAARVPLEQVQRASAVVDEDAAESMLRSKRSSCGGSLPMPGRGRRRSRRARRR